jgi:hypothetical protein
MNDYNKLRALYENLNNQFDIDSYMQGNCAILALALNKLTGWRIYILSDPDGEGWYDEDDGDNDIEYSHVVVEHPSGKYLDVNGLMTNKALSEYFGVDYLNSYDIASEGLEQIINDPDGPFDTTVSEDEAIEVAKKLLESIPN